ncbi:MAG: [FeFe] hydrogenase H-cluster maturation GTPase HydF [Planctomycetota bacterium]|nr:[FeFe] hydrogenase H-cluster maturation GTPase HydF [Planctomycetota bacterium]
MFKTPKSLRLHIGIFGRRNAGKSSILNALVRQQVSIVSDVPGTTTDPVEKVMELKPIGPVVFIDTAGIDDTGELGRSRIKKTTQVIERTELAILVTDGWQSYEAELLKLFKTHNIPVVVAANKSDVREDNELETAARNAGCKFIVTTSIAKMQGIDDLRTTLAHATPQEFMTTPPVLGDLIKPDDLVVLVTPIDIEAPAGRMLLPQVQALRDTLDNNAYCLIVKEHQLAHALASLKKPPALVVTDSQAFEKVSQIVPDEVPLTSFSILFARLKGDLAEFVKGVKSIDSLREGDKVLIAEACTHHPLKDDIGRIKIPRWLQEYTGVKLKIDVVAGRDLPDDLTPYKLIVHCAGCVFNRQQMLSRIEKAQKAKVPITNYGMAISYIHGIFNRAMQPFAKTGFSPVKKK